MPSTSGGASIGSPPRRNGSAIRSSSSPALRSPSARYASPITITASSSSAGSRPSATSRARSAALISAAMSPVLIGKIDASRYIAAARSASVPRAASASAISAW